MAKYQIIAKHDIQVDGAPDGKVKGGDVLGTLETDCDPRGILGMLTYGDNAKLERVVEGLQASDNSEASQAATRRQNRTKSAASAGNAGTKSSHGSKSTRRR